VLSLHPWQSCGCTHARAGQAVPFFGARECQRHWVLNPRPASTVERTQRPDLFPGIRIGVESAGRTFGWASDVVRLRAAFLEEPGTQRRREERSCRERQDVEDG
jgi:hypothetical protein